MTQDTSPRSRPLLVAGGLVLAAAIVGGLVWMQGAPTEVSAPAGTAPAAAAAAPADAKMATDAKMPTDAKAPPDAKVVATVNGRVITATDLAAAERELGGEMRNLQPDARRKAVLEAVIDLTLVAQAAETAKLDESAEFRERMALVREQVLRAEYVRTSVMSGATEEAIKKRYDEEVAKLDLPDEVKASHILVATEDEAKAVIDELAKGGDFVAIAKEKSTDKASGAKGGELGYFTQEDMVKPFADAAFEMKPGDISTAPVKSDFGFHVIKLEDRRKKAPPTFDQVKEQVRQMVVADIYRDTLKKLREGAKIDVVTEPTPPPAAPVPAPAAPAAPAPADEKK